MSMSDYLLEDIEKQMFLENKNNRSEFICEMIRKGLIENKKIRYGEKK